MGQLVLAQRDLQVQADPLGLEQQVHQDPKDKVGLPDHPARPVVELQDLAGLPVQPVVVQLARVDLLVLVAHQVELVQLALQVLVVHPVLKVQQELRVPAGQQEVAQLGHLVLRVVQGLPVLPDLKVPRA